jgi:hypothetical protein
MRKGRRLNCQRDTGVVAAVDRQASARGGVGCGLGVGEADGGCIPGLKFKSHCCGCGKGAGDVEGAGDCGATAGTRGIGSAA